jgi:hypothetical protein
VLFFDHLHVNVKFRILFRGQYHHSGQFLAFQKTAFLLGFSQKISKSSKKQNAPYRILERFLTISTAWGQPTDSQN